jgi:hypothetical protein
MHPTTYINKLLFAGENRNIELWNIIDDELIYKFSNILKDKDEKSNIKCIV